jgi:hypothetical protein
MSYKVRRGRLERKKIGPVQEIEIEFDFDENGRPYLPIPMDIFPPDVRERLDRLSAVHGDGWDFAMPEGAARFADDGSYIIDFGWLLKKGDN